MRTCLSNLVLVFLLLGLSAPAIAQNGTPDDAEALVRRAKAFAAEAGKNMCIDSAVNNKGQSELLRKYKVSVASLCGCVERALLVLIPTKLATTLLVEAQASQSQNDSSKISQTTVDQLSKLENVANSDCFQQLLRL